MKTLRNLAATALLSWMAAAPALAAPPPANLAVFSENGQPFSLVLDGRLLTRAGVPQVRVGWLAPGRHYADISLPTPYGPPLSFRTVVWLQPGRESDYMLVVRRWGPQLQQVSAAPPYPGGYYGGAPAPVGGYPAPTAPGGGYGPGNYPPATTPSGGYDPNGSYPAPGYPNGSYPAPASPNGDNYPAPGSPAGNYPAPGHPGNGSGYYPGPATGLPALSTAEITGLLQAIQRASFDRDKLTIARQALSQSSVRAEELAALVKALSFSDARVDLATFGYAHVSDPQNFYMVYSSLSFSSDVQKVQQALGL